jgi:hypothetical protein
VDTIPINGFHVDGGCRFRLSGSWSGGHNGDDLGSIGVMEGTRVVLAEPGVLEGMRVVDLMCLREVEPEVAKGFPWDKLELGKGVLVSGRPSKVGNKGVNRCFDNGGRAHGGGGIVESSWHC